MAYLRHIFPRYTTPFAHSNGVVIRTNSAATNIVLNPYVNSTDKTKGDHIDFYGAAGQITGPKDGDGNYTGFTVAFNSFAVNGKVVGLKVKEGHVDLTNAIVEEDEEIIIYATTTDVKVSNPNKVSTHAHATNEESANTMNNPDDDAKKSVGITWDYDNNVAQNAIDDIHHHITDEQAAAARTGDGLGTGPVDGGATWNYTEKVEYAIGSAMTTESADGKTNYQISIKDGDGKIIYTTFAGFRDMVMGVNEDGSYNAVHNDLKGCTVKLISDVEIFGEWLPIGSYKEVKVNGESTLRLFAGTFDGQGHTIHANIDNSSKRVKDNEYDNTGIFGCITASATITNFTVDGRITCVEGKAAIIKCFVFSFNGSHCFIDNFAYFRCMCCSSYSFPSCFFWNEEDVVLCVGISIIFKTIAFSN